ncbi:hypothetical protein MPER_04616 [Moniliophthora perniciosa FA553]|nr:hypothetical protein MPER_04616 [Moniliophthora perniciosa FA553]
MTRLFLEPSSTFVPGPTGVTDLGLKREKIGDLSTENDPTHLLLVCNCFRLYSPCRRSARRERPSPVSCGVDSSSSLTAIRAESAFKALALAIKQAIERTGSNDVPSTKGVL